MLVLISLRVWLFPFRSFVVGNKSSSDTVHGHCAKILQSVYMYVHIAVYTVWTCAVLDRDMDHETFRVRWCTCRSRVFCESSRRVEEGKFRLHVPCWLPVTSVCLRHWPLLLSDRSETAQTYRISATVRESPLVGSMTRLDPGTAIVSTLDPGASVSEGREDGSELDEG